MLRACCALLLGLTLALYGDARSATRTGTAGGAGPGAATPSLQLVANGGFEDGILRPWQPGGSVRPLVVTWPHHAGRYAALLGRLSSGPTVTSTLSLSLTVPPTATVAGLSLYAWRHCRSPHSRSLLGLTVRIRTARPPSVSPRARLLRWRSTT